MKNTVSPCTVNDPTNGTPYTIDHDLLFHLVGGVRPLMVVHTIAGAHIGVELAGRLTTLAQSIIKN